jgi:hypothetical protein
MDLFNCSLASLGHFYAFGLVQKRKKHVTKGTYLCVFNATLGHQLAYVPHKCVVSTFRVEQLALMCPGDRDNHL